MLSESVSSDKPRYWREGQVLMKDPVSKTESGHNVGALVGLEVSMWKATLETREGMRLRPEFKEEARVEQRVVIRCWTPGSLWVEGLLATQDSISELVALSVWSRLATARNMSHASSEQLPMMLGLLGLKELSRTWKFKANPAFRLCRGTAREIHRVMRRQDTLMEEPSGSIGDQTVGTARELRLIWKLSMKRERSLEKVSALRMLMLERVSRTNSKRAYHLGFEEWGSEGQMSQGIQKMVVPLSSKVEPNIGSSIAG